MREKKSSTKYKVPPALLESPHIADQLLQLLLGEWQPDPSQEEQLTTHFIACSQCRTALILLLSTEQKYERLSNCAEDATHDLLMRLVSIHHKLEARNAELLGAYGEAIVSHGREEADQRFPILAEYIRKNPEYQSRLEETLAFLHEFQDASQETH
jgi:hypothetical protein